MSFYVDKAGKVIEVTAGLGSEDELESIVKEIIAAAANEAAATLSAPGAHGRSNR